MAVCTCLARERLRDFVRGGLDRAGHEAIEQHLNDCTDCENEVASLDDSTPAPLPRGRPRVQEDPLAEDDPFRQLVASAKAMGCLPPTADVSKGEVLGNYELLEPLGAGGMGRVFKAWHRRLKRVVALKILAPHLLPSASARARFQREMEAVARLKSPHIVTAHDAGEVAGRDFLVMEYVEGRTLAEVVRAEGPLAVTTAVGYALQAARGLSHAHAAGIVHRDVKPANLLLDQAGVVKVLDLGLALASDHQRKTGGGEVTSSGVVVGTAPFMAPEQAFDSRRADHRADVYSLGCTLYFLLTGRPPFEGETPLATLLAHREQPVPSVRASRPECPAELDRLLRAMLAKRPEERVPTMRAVIARLEGLATAAPPVPRERPRPRKLPQVVGVALAAAILAVAGAAMLWPEAPPGLREKDPGGPMAVVPPRVPEGWVLIPAGSFEMGSPDSDRDAAADEKPLHKVNITRPFLLHATKVTQAEFQAVMGTNPSSFAAKGRSADKVRGLDTGRHPVESISWFDAVRYCNARSQRDDLKPYYDLERIDHKEVTVNGGPGYRLPTEAEWEYACRAGTATRWSFGDDVGDLGTHAWHAGNSDGTTHPVGLKKANPWGLFDMHGNVPEWCWDRYAADYYKGSPGSDPPGPGHGPTRVHRGGRWDDNAAQMRSAARQGLGGGYHVLNIVGLRLARDSQP